MWTRIDEAHLPKGQFRFKSSQVFAVSDDTVNRTQTEEIRDICDAFVHGLRQVLVKKLYAAYIFGAAAFPDALPTGDIDFHVILNDELTVAERSALEELHRTLADRFPPLGGELDGYYILLADARRDSPPQSQMWRRATDDSWALHCEHIRAGRHIVLHGPDPRELYPSANWVQTEAALRNEFDFVREHLQDYPDYCILNLCRLIYSYETKDVVISKAKAADWAHEALPSWKRHIDLARKSYTRQITSEERGFILAEAASFFEFARSRIEKARSRRGKE